jgi:hypothetical protein
VEIVLSLRPSPREDHVVGDGGTVGGAYRAAFSW